MLNYLTLASIGAIVVAVVGYAVVVVGIFVVVVDVAVVTVDGVVVILCGLVWQKEVNATNSQHRPRRGTSSCPSGKLRRRF